MRIIKYLKLFFKRRKVLRDIADDYISRESLVVNEAYTGRTDVTPGDVIIPDNSFSDMMNDLDSLVNDPAIVPIANERDAKMHLIRKRIGY